VTVVSNTSPITNLAAINHLHLLNEIYGTITIPLAVYEELTVLEYPVPGTTEVQTLNWIEVRQLKDSEQSKAFRQIVDPGEAEAIALALELKATRLLIDDSAGRALAESIGLKSTGVLGVLLITKQRGLIAEVRPLLEDLVEQAAFRVSPALYQAVLEEAEE
jgi:hypothetical protein